MSKRGVYIVYSAVLIAFTILLGFDCGLAGTLNFQPQSLERTLFSKRFNDLTISGPTPEGCQIILKIVAPNQEFKLNKSGKGLGLIWLPIGHAEVKNIPGMYALLSSARISAILSKEEQQDTGLCSDFKEIYQLAKIHHKKNPKEEEAAGLNREYVSGLIKILVEKKLYQNKEGTVAVAGGQFKAQLLHPVDGPLGEYRVFCYAIKDGKVRLLTEDGFSVKSSGLGDWLYRQAVVNAVVYGILAALMAIGAGLLVGVIFKKGGGH